jgi:hypothetical protein
MFDPQPVQIDTRQLKQLFVGFMRHLLRKKAQLLLCVAMALSGTLVWIWVRKPAYKAVSTFVLEEKSSGGGGIAGLASQFGIDLGSMSAGANGFFTGENIDDILSSTTVMEKVLLSPIDSSTNKTVLLADRYLDASGMRESMTWKRLLSGFSFGGHPTTHQTTTSEAAAGLALASGHLKKQSSTPQQRFRDSVLYVVMDRIAQKDLQVERSNKKGTIFFI